MKPLSILALLISLAALGLTFNHSPPSSETRHLQENTYQRVLRTGEIRCAYATLNPLIVVDPGTKQISGLFYDLMTEVGKRLSLKINWVEEVGYGTIAEGFTTDRYDAFCSSLWPTAERSRAASFTIPIYYSKVDVIVRANDHRFDNDLAKLNDPAITFSVKDGDISEAFTNSAFPLAKHMGASDMADESQMLEDIVYGKADAHITAPEVFYRYLEKNPGSLRDITEAHPLRVSPNTMMLKPGQFQFKMMLDTTLTELLNDGTIDNILRKYETYPTYLPVNLPYRQLDQP